MLAKEHASTLWFDPPHLQEKKKTVGRDVLKIDIKRLEKMVIHVNLNIRVIFPSEIRNVC
jgi:hypothetical protein